MDKLIIIDLIIYLVLKYSQLLFSKKNAWFNKKKYKFKKWNHITFSGYIFSFYNQFLQEKQVKRYFWFCSSSGKGILSDSINTSGEVKAIRTSNIGPRKQGVIKEIKVEEGDLVEKDQVLGSLDDEDFI